MSRCALVRGSVKALCPTAFTLDIRFHLINTAETNGEKLVTPARTEHYEEVGHEVTILTVLGH